MRRTVRSIYHALRGILYALRREPNFLIESVAAGTVVMLMIVLPLSGLERAVLLLTIALVLGLELANTAAERVMDILKPRVHPYARVVKDAMAGSVLIAAVAAVFIGICILAPYF